MAAFVIPNGYRRHRDLVLGLGQLLLALLFVEALMKIAESLVSLYGTAPAHFVPIHEQLYGPYWWVFWIIGLVLAVGVPMIMLATTGQRNPLAVGGVALVSAIAFIGQFNLFVEPVAKARNSLTGEPFSSLPIYEPVKEADGTVVSEDGYDFHLIMFKEIIGGQSRTVGNYWTQHSLLAGGNRVLMNRLDMLRLGLKEGDRVRLVSATNPEGVWDLGNGRKVEVAGLVKGVEGIRPGTVASGP